MPVLLASVGLLLAAMAPDQLKSADAPGLSAIKPASLSASIRFLSDDLLEGRDTGTPGHALAARYSGHPLRPLVAQIFPTSGLERWNRFRTEVVRKRIADFSRRESRGKRLERHASEFVQRRHHRSFSCER